MHTTVEYNVNKQDGKEKALKDIKEWMGTKRYNTMVDELKLIKTPNTEQFQFYLGLTGIQGYPVKVLYEEIYGIKWGDADA